MTYFDDGPSGCLHAVRLGGGVDVVGVEVIEVQEVLVPLQLLGVQGHSL